MKKFLLLGFVFFISTVFIMTIGDTKVAQAAPNISVVSPNGGEHFTQGETVTIRWNQSNVDRVTISFVQNASSYNTIEINLIVNPQATEGSYQWTIPTTTSVSGNSFRISLRGWETNVGASDDLSDATFSINPRQLPPVTIALSPQTPSSSIIPRGDQFVPILSFTITNSNQSPEVGIILSCEVKGLQQNFGLGDLKMRTKEGNTIISPTSCAASNITPGQSRTFTVEASFDGRTGGWNNQHDIYLQIIAMTALSSVNEQLQVVGLPIRGNTFIIPAYSSASPTPVINVLTPTTHETWHAGEVKTIKWTATNLPPEANNSVKLFFISPVDGSGIGPVAKFVNTGSAQFTVPSYDVDRTSLIRIAVWCSSGNPLCTSHADGEKTVTIIAGSPNPSPTPTPTPDSVPTHFPSPLTTPSSNSQVLNISNRVLYNRLKGNILIKPEDSGKAYYIHPLNQKSYFLGRPSDAFSVMKEQGVGISNKDLQKIPVGVEQMSGADQDGDALSDLFEDSMGMNKNNRDSDGDGNDDRIELLNGYNPLGSGKLSFNSTFTKTQQGRILLQVEGKGEAWYIKNNKRYFLGRPSDAFYMMQNLGTGISNKDFNSL